MSANDGKHLLESWLKASNRNLTASQMLEVLDAFNECPYPLFLKVCIKMISSRTRKIVNVRLGNSASKNRSSFVRIKVLQSKKFSE